MALRRTDILIAQAREEAGEVDYSEASDPNERNGVPQSVPLQAFREAVVHCQNAIYGVASRTFDNSTIIDGVADSVEYELPENAYLGSSILALEYSRDGSDENYYPLALRDFGYRSNDRAALPSRYVPYGERNFLVDPRLDSSVGSFRVWHGKHLDKPELRRGRITNAANDGTNYTILTLDSATADDIALSGDEWICINDRNGVVKYYNIYYTAYDTSAKTITLDSALMADGDIAVGDYVTVGKFTTTHVKLDETAEPIIMAFLRRRFYLGKSSDDVNAETENITAFTTTMVNVFQKRNRDKKKVPYTGKFENI